MLRLFRNSALIYLLSGVLARAGAFLLVPVYTRRMSPEEYSRYATFTSLQPMLLTLFSLGLASSITRSFYSPREGVRPDDAVGDVARGMILVGVVLGVLASTAAMLVLPRGVLLLDASMLHLLIWASVLGNIGQLPEQFLRVAQKPWQASGLRLLTFLITVSLGLLLVLGMGRTGRGAVEALALATALQGLVGLWFIFGRLGSYSLRTTLPSELRMSFPLIPHAIALTLQQVGDRIALSAQENGATNLGLYYLAIQFNTPLALVVDAWNTAQIPKIGEAFREGGEDGAARLLPSQYLQFGGVALVTALGLVAVSPLLPYLIGERFRGAASLLPPLALASVIEALYLPSVNFLIIVGHTRLIPVATWISAAVSVGLVVLLLPRFSLSGLLMARVISAVVRAGAMGLLVRWYRRPTAMRAPGP